MFCVYDPQSSNEVTTLSIYWFIWPLGTHTAFSHCFLFLLFMETRVRQVISEGLEMEDPQEPWYTLSLLYCCSQFRVYSDVYWFSGQTSKRSVRHLNYFPQNFQGNHKKQLLSLKIWKGGGGMKMSLKICKKDTKVRKGKLGTFRKGPM